MNLYVPCLGHEAVFDCEIEVTFYDLRCGSHSPFPPQVLCVINHYMIRILKMVVHDKGLLLPSTIQGEDIGSGPTAWGSGTSL